MGDSSLESQVELTETKTKNPYKKCRSPSISSTQLWLRKKLNTRKSDWCKPQTASSWTSNAQTAVKSCPNPPVARPDSQVDAVSERSKTSKLFRASIGKSEKLRNN